VLPHMTELFAPEAIAVLFQVVMIDLALAGDNAIVVGMAAAGLPPTQRTRAIFFGMMGATVLLIVFAGITTQLLKIVGLLFAGGVLLLWVCWKMWRELHMSHHQPKLQSLSAASTIDVSAGAGHQKTLSQAVWQITIADVSMSLDNVLAVAGAAREHPMILIFGLALSIALMGLAANFIARLLEKHRWIAYVGLAIILYVAFDMCYRGALEVWPHLNV
jgi:YjbE family integral membrane protein